MSRTEPRLLSPPVPRASLRCATPQSRDAIKLAVHARAPLSVHGALGHPHGEDERQAGPLLPFQRRDRRRTGSTLAARRCEHECGVADDEPRFVVLVAESRDIARARRCPARTGAARLPHVLEQAAPAVRTLVMELRLTSTRCPSSSGAGRLEKSITLRTGPSQEIARSGSSR